MKSSLKNMVMVLLLVTLVASAAVGVVNRMTTDPIRKAKEARITEAIGKVLPPFDNNPSETVRKEGVDGDTVVIYTATKSGGETVGYAMETFTDKGFGGNVKLMVGFLPDGTINAVEVLEHKETPGLGDKMDPKKSPFSLQFQGKNPKDLKLAVKKDGGDVDAITASTISSRAFCDAVERAYKVYQSIEE